MFILAVGLAARFGLSTLGAVLGAGLLSYGVLFPLHWFGLIPVSGPGTNVAGCLAGIGLGAAAGRR